MIRRKQKLHVFKAMSNVQGALAITGISKDRKNKEQNYSFRGIDDIYEALAPLLAAESLLIVPFVVERTCIEKMSKSGGVLLYTTVLVDYQFISAVDGSKHTARVSGEAMDSGDKSTNKAMSSAYKNMALQAFAIPVQGGDNDSENTSHELARSEPPSAAPAQPPPSNWGHQLLELARKNNWQDAAVKEWVEDQLARQLTDAEVFTIGRRRFGKQATA